MLILLPFLKLYTYYELMHHYTVVEVSQVFYEQFEFGRWSTLSYATNHTMKNFSTVSFQRISHIGIYFQRLQCQLVNLAASRFGLLTTSVQIKQNHQPFPQPRFIIPFICPSLSTHLSLSSSSSSPSSLQPSTITTHTNPPHKLTSTIYVLCTNSDMMQIPTMIFGMLSMIG